MRNCPAQGFPWRNRRLTGAALLLVLVMLPACARRPAEGGPSLPAPAAPVVTAKAELRDVPVQLTAIGRVEPFSIVTVRAQVSGQLSKVHFVEGQDVKAGDLLFTIDSRPFEAELRRTEAELAQDVARTRDAEAEAKRQVELMEINVAAEREHDQALANAEALRAVVRADQASVDLARLRVGYCSVTAPIGGRTGKRLVDVGNIVRENDSAMVQINQLAPIHVAFSVPEQHLAQIQARMAAEQLTVHAIIPGQPEGPETGVLTFLDNQVDTETGTISLKGQFDNARRRLWPGQFVQVSLTLNAIRNAVVVPVEAIQTGQTGEFVFVLQPDSTVQMREVKAGLTHAGGIVVQEGIRPGEVVITDGQLRLVPGARVSVKAPPSTTRQAQS